MRSNRCASQLFCGTELGTDPPDISFNEFSDSPPLSLQFQRCDSFELSFLSLVAVYSRQTRGLPLRISTPGCSATNRFITMPLSPSYPALFSAVHRQCVNFTVNSVLKRLCLIEVISSERAE